MKIFPSLVLVALTLLSACGSDIAPGRSGSEPIVVKGLTTATVDSQPTVDTRYFVGTVESTDRAILTARIDGRVTSFKVKAGDRVAAGALLLTIGDTPTGAQLAGAESTRQAAAARLALAEQTLARFRQLQAAEAVTPQEFDRVNSEAEQARGGLHTAEAALAQAQIVAGHTRVVAPYAAQVVSTAVEAGSTVMPGTPLLTLDRTGGWHARLTCPEGLLGRIAPGVPLEVEVPSLQRVFPATVSEVEAAADPGSRSFRIKATLPADPALAAGLFARAAYGGGAAGTMVSLPAAAVLTRGQLTGVYVVENGILRWRLVRTGRVVGERLEILSGLVAGEKVVVGGVERAVSGARVEN